VRRGVAAGVATFVVIVAVGAVFAEDIEEATTSAASKSSTTTTTGLEATTTTIAVLVPADDPNATTTTTRGGPGAFPLPGDPTADPGPQLAPPPAPPAPEPPPEFGQATIRVASFGDGRVSVDWSSTGGTSATVSGPAVSASGLSGHVGPVCPVTEPRSGRCVPAGPYVYTITLYGSRGQVLDQKSASGG
jgi:hypothetical protein